MRAYPTLLSALLTLPLFSLLSSCTCQREAPQGLKTPSSPGLAEPRPPQGQGGPQALPPAEELASSWNSALALPVDPPPQATGEPCPDSDSDGFQDIWSCPFLPASQADCDDDDPQTTPATEIWVPAGPFLMGSASSEAGADERPVHAVVLSGYCLDRDELSKQVFEDWREGRPANDRAVAGDTPAEGVTFEEAAAFCESAGKRLPTEAQWEKAARGGCELGQDPRACDISDLRPYPWGVEPPSCERANHRLTITGAPQARLCEGRAGAVDRALGVGPYGHRNIAGNVWEWVSDWYHPALYPSGVTRKDPLGPESGGLHTLRGGSWNTFSTNMRVANRFTSNLEGSSVGLRCARGWAVGTRDNVKPLTTARVLGEVWRPQGPITGKALYVSAFDIRDLDPAGQAPLPGRSPVAEVRMVPANTDRVAFKLEIPKGVEVLIMTSLDAGEPPQGAGAPPSASGGFARSDKTFKVTSDLDGIVIRLGEAQR